MAPTSTAQLAETAKTRTFDPISMEVFSNRLLAITEEMGNLLIRSSFSTNIKERKDCSVAIFDRRGRLVVQATHIPLHVGSLSGAVRSEEHTSELQSLMRISYAVFCLKKK